MYQTKGIAVVAAIVATSLIAAAAVVTNDAHPGITSNTMACSPTNN
jgi:hypothetical protein